MPTNESFQAAVNLIKDTGKPILSLTLAACLADPANGEALYEHAFKRWKNLKSAKDQLTDDQVKAVLAKIYGPVDLDNTSKTTTIPESR